MLWLFLVEGMKKILFIEWKSFANDYMIRAFEKKNIVVEKLSFDTETESTRNSEKLANLVANKLLQGNFDAVFSFNFFPVVAIACKACKTIYISWTYDSPYVQLYSETVKYDTNRIFIFDSAEYQRLLHLGIEHVYYLPMAADVAFYDEINRNTGKAYQHEISFVGSTYSEKKQQIYRHLDQLDEYTRGYLEGAMLAQKNVYGCNFMEQILTPDIVKNMQKVCPLMGNGDGMETVEWSFARYFLDRKITSMERVEILDKLSQVYTLDLFTPEATPMLKKVHNRGKVDYYDEAPIIFRTSKINLNISLKSIVNGIPLRAFDIMGCGGFLLSNYQPDFMTFFEPDVDFVYYEDQEDLMNKVAYYLKNDEERERIARNGYEKVKKFHSYDQRVEEILNVI